MTAGKNQSQPVIFKAVVFVRLFRRRGLRFEMPNELVLRGVESCPPAQSINGFESRRRDQPGSRVARYSGLRPQTQRSRTGVVHRLLGEIKIAKPAVQSCPDPSSILAIKGLEPFGCR